MAKAKTKPKISDPKVQELSDLLGNVDKKSKILVVDHAQGDPDSIASKYGMRYILTEHFGFETELAYNVEPGHFQNKTLIKILTSHYGFSPTPMNEIKINDYGLICCVDFNLSMELRQVPFTAEMLSNLKSDQVFIIDHHKKGKEESILPILEDITESGICSTSTRIVEYLEALKIKLDPEKEEDKNLATSLCFGIEKDAISRDGKKARDRLALAYISSAISPALEKRLISVSRSSQSQDAIGEGLKNRRKVNIYSIGSSGILIEDNKNAIAELSDQLVMEAGIDASIAYGVIGDNIEMSFRASDASSQNAYNLAQLFSEKSGGGSEAAGATVELGPFNSFTRNDEESEQLLIQAIEELLIIPKLKEITG